MNEKNPVVPYHNWSLLSSNGQGGGSEGCTHSHDLTAVDDVVRAGAVPCRGDVLTRRPAVPTGVSRRHCKEFLPFEGRKAERLRSFV